MKKVTLIVIAVMASLTMFAQKNKMHKADTTMSVKAKYCCSMHPEVTSDKPGKCTKCGMDLTKSKKEHMKMEVMKSYSCPMHPEVTSDKPGKCTKCGMDLSETKTKVKTKRG
ncbi:heavy metal-binding domain-containing protein [Ferruginibacter sp. SUN106]|uniref:heavy metal-binding domain-containing protein n=1 Tax=Ferruginibacter sp. SUN106 TaxID=2978348 RepID=UPI003D35FDEA